jgi:hypothetical protein
VANRVLEYFRSIPPAPEPIVGMGTFPAISASILYWESVRDQAIGMGHHSLGRTADELAEAHRSAWSRLSAQGDCRCPVSGDKIVREPSPVLHQRTSRTPTKSASGVETVIEPA